MRGGQSSPGGGAGPSPGGSPTQGGFTRNIAGMLGDSGSGTKRRRM